MDAGKIQTPVNVTNIVVVLLFGSSVWFTAKYKKPKVVITHAEKVILTYWGILPIFFGSA